MKKLLVVAVAAAVLAPAARAASELDFAQSLSPAFHALADGRYKLVEKKANQTLDILKALRDFAGDVQDSSDKLRKEMLGNHYDDMVNTSLMPALFEAKSTHETVKKTYDLEKDNIKGGLKAAKAGDYANIDAAIGRVQAFEAEYEGKTKAIEARVNGVRAAYQHDFGNANAALAQFNALPLVKELLAARPKLVSKIELQPISIRPLKWKIEFVKENKKYNDPRYDQLPRTVTISDGGDVTYPVVVR